MTLSGIAVALVSHGDRAGTEPNATLLSHAGSVSALLPSCTVTAGVLKGTPSLEDALRLADASGAREIAIYPLFMSDGYFTGTVLPQRIWDAGRTGKTRILRPLGLDPGLPDLILADAMRAAEAARMAPGGARLLIVGHGSKLGPESARATRRAADAVARASLFAKVETAFLDEEPHLVAALRREHPQTVVSGFFFGDGLHAGEDVPAAIRELGAAAVYAGPIGSASAIPSLIAAALRAGFRAEAH